MKRLPKITAYFALGGQFDPEDLTKELGIIADRTWTQERPNLKARSDLNHAEWCVGVTSLESDSIEAAVAIAVARVWEARTHISAVVASRQLKASVICDVTHWGERPLYVLSSGILKKLAELNVEFGLDIFEHTSE